MSKYPPGAALLAAPLYLVFDEAERIDLTGSPDRPSVSADLPSRVPATVVSSGAAAAAAAFLTISVVGLVGNRQAIIAGLLGGLGTGAWSVASNELWQHGPAMLWLSVGVYQLTRRRHFPAGVAFGLAVLTRPLTALIGAITGLWIALAHKSIRPAILIGAGTSIGLTALVIYNWTTFGNPSVSGGYGLAFAEQLTQSDLGWYLQNIARALIDPARGLLIWAPFLVMLAPGFSRAWRAAPSWAQGAALGGVVYLLIQLKANRFSGGAYGFFAYRYPLETLVVAAPLLVLSYREGVMGKPFRSRLFRWSAGLAVASQLYGAIVY